MTPKGYWIGHVTITNPDRYPEYMAAAQPAYERYGARFLARGGKFEAVEGASRERHVIVEFPSYEKAVACYQSSEYQKAAKIRQEISKGDILILEGAI